MKNISILICARIFLLKSLSLVFRKDYIEIRFADILVFSDVLIVGIMLDKILRWPRKARRYKLRGPIE